MVLDSNYGNSLNDFKDFYLDLGISVTPKVHILVMHVPEFISNMTDLWAGIQSRLWKLCIMTLKETVGRNNLIKDLKTIQIMHKI